MIYPKARILSAPPLISVLLACLGILSAQDPKALLKSLLEGQEVVLKLEMPATKEGVDVRPEKAPSVEFSKHEKLKNRHGVALQRGQTVRITKIEVEGKHIEIHLDGGGCCPYGWPERFVPAPKSTAEIDLEQAMRAARTRDEYNRLYQQLRALQAARLQADAVRRQEYERQVMEGRPQFGSRFNVRYSKKLTREQTTEESVIVALADYVDFPHLRLRSFQELVAKAEGLSARQSFLQAAVAWREVLLLDRSNARAQQALIAALQAMNLQAQSAFDQGELKQAEGTWKAVLNFVPQDPAAQAGIAQVETALRIADLLKEAEEHFANEEYSEAKANWADVLRLDGANTQALEGIARIREAAPEVEEVGESYAVIIGVSKFQDPKVPPLRYTDDDARAIYQVLIDAEIGGFPKENVQLLVDEEATTQQIKATMGTWLRREADENDTVIVFFAGHGAPETDVDAGQKTYWLTYDTQIDDLYSSALSNDEIADMLSRLRARRIVALIDSCYSAATVNRTVGTRGSIIVDDPFSKFKGQGRVTITSSDGREESLELTEYEHGVFTYHLLEALKGQADTNRDGIVMLDEVWEHVNHTVPETARKHGGKQTPIIDGSYSAGIQLARMAGAVGKRVLDRLYTDRLMETSHYVEAVELLGTAPEELGDCQKRIRSLIDQLVRGELEPEAYRVARQPLCQ